VAITLLAILVLAFAVRVVWRIQKGSDDFWASGSSLMIDLATNLASGKGLHIDGSGWALSVPAYPFFLSMLSIADKNFFWIFIPQALLGAGTALCAYWIGRELFNRFTGLIACLITALYPYYVANDTALRDTGLLTFLTALAVYLLLRGQHTSTYVGWTLAGLALGASVLTRRTMLLFAIGALIWVFLCCAGTWTRRLDRLVAITAAFALLVGLWMARNYMAIGAPVLTSESGRNMWVGNNAATFSHYPAEGIDRSAQQAMASLSAEQQQELEGISDEILRSDWFQEKAVTYMKGHPGATIGGAFRKILAGFSWVMNPSRRSSTEIAYALSYGPISVLGLLGIALTWRRWKELSLIYWLFLAFIIDAALYWAQSYTRSYLDVYWIVFASYVLTRWFPKWGGWWEKSN